MRTISDNRFKVGLFSSNAWGGLTQTLAPERWDASWDSHLELARQADRAGVDFLLPLGTWLGLNGGASTDGWSYETLTWAAGTLQATERITVFATLQTAYLNPIFAAKQIATCDHIGRGRFGLNVVSGAKREEFDLMGVPFGEHDDRYALTEEWVDILRRLWTEPEPFDVHGRFHELRGAWSRPAPYGDEPPLIISAGSSPTGRRFAMRHADCLFMLIVDLETLGEEIAAVRKGAGRPLGVYASGHMFCRPTRAETEEYYHHIVHECGDWSAAEHLLRNVKTNSGSTPADRLSEMLERCVSGHGTYLVKGTPDEVAATLARMSEAGLDGMAIAFANYLDDFPVLRDEVLPRLERLGLRSPVAGVAAMETDQGQLA